MCEPTKRTGSDNVTGDQVSYHHGAIIGSLAVYLGALLHRHTGESVLMLIVGALPYVLVVRCLSEFLNRIDFPWTKLQVMSVFFRRLLDMLVTMFISDFLVGSLPSLRACLAFVPIVVFIFQLKRLASASHRKESFAWNMLL